MSRIQALGKIAELKAQIEELTKELNKAKVGCNSSKVMPSGSSQTTRRVIQ